MCITSKVGRREKGLLELYRAQCSQQTSTYWGLHLLLPPTNIRRGPGWSQSPEEQQSPDSPHAGRLRAAGTVLLSTSSSYCTLARQAGGQPQWGHWGVSLMGTLWGQPQ